MRPDVMEDLGRLRAMIEEFVVRWSGVESLAAVLCALRLMSARMDIVREEQVSRYQAQKERSEP